MPGVLVTAKIWRWTLVSKRGSNEAVFQVAQVAPGLRGVRLNPYSSATSPVAGSGRAGRVLKGRTERTSTIARHSTTTGGTSASESAAMLVDVVGDAVGDSTKWCVASNGIGAVETWAVGHRFYLEWEWPRLVTADSVYLTTGNDDASFPNRQPVSWLLDAYLPGKGWHRVHTARNVNPPTTNGTVYGPFYFTAPRPVGG